MYKRLLRYCWMMSCFILLIACQPNDDNTDRQKTPVQTSKQTLGVQECVTLSPEGIILSAKLDTGADYASLHAEDITTFTRDGQTWVRFTTLAPNLPSGKQQLEKPLVRYAKIKRSDVRQSAVYRPTERPVVKMALQVGGKTLEVEVNLTDRSRFTQPLLLGKATLNRFAIIVDPGQSYTITNTCETSR
jgi:hypothetical protein